MDQPGDPEADELRNPVDRDQNIARLQIAMDHHVPVREMDGLANRDEEPQPHEDIEPAAVAVFIDPTAVDVLRHDVRPAVLGRAGVKETGDVGMLAESGLNAELGLESPHDRIAVSSARNQRDGNLLPEVLDSRGAIDGPHAPAADPRRELIRADPSPDHRVVLAGCDRLDMRRDLSLAPVGHGPDVVRDRDRRKTRRRREGFQRHRLDHIQAHRGTRGVVGPIGAWVASAVASSSGFPRLWSGIMIGSSPLSGPASRRAEIPRVQASIDRSRSAPSLIAILPL